MPSTASACHRRATVLALAISTVLLPLAGVPAAQAQPAVVAPLRQYAIPEQPLADAVRAFGRQADAQVVFRSDLVEGRRSSAVSGEYSQMQALQQLLRGSGVRAQRGMDGTWSLRAASEAGEGEGVRVTETLDVAGRLQSEGGEARDRRGYDDVFALDLTTAYSGRDRFYVNATEAPWSDHYRMYDYVVSELPALVEKNFPVSQARSISGHSMGGHGALVIALRNPGRYRSVSAFSPIVAPTQVPWGQKAFSAYLGGDQEQWRQYDAVELIADAKERLPLLVDQGLSDDFLQNQLRPELLRDACAKANHPLSLNLRDGYDHSYYFISSFIADHLRHHASALST